MIVVESVIEALDSIDDPDPIVRSVLATWKTQVLLDVRRDQVARDVRYRGIDRGIDPPMRDPSYVS